MTKYAGFYKYRTLFYYSDGDIIDLYYSQDKGIITDLGETVRWFKMTTAQLKLTEEHYNQIRKCCKCEGFKYSNGMIMKELNDCNDFDNCITHMAEVIEHLTKIGVR